MPEVIKPLYLIVMDQYAGFAQRLFPELEHLPEGEKDQIRRIKLVILEGIKKSLTRGVPKQHIGIILDEPQGTVALQESIREGFFTGISIDCNQRIEDFDKVVTHQLDTFSPLFVKTTILDINNIDLLTSSQLKTLSNISVTRNIPLYLELLSSTKSDINTAASALNDAGIVINSWIVPVSNATQIQKNQFHQSFIISMPDHISPNLLALPEVIGFSNPEQIYWDPVIEFFKGRIDGYRAAETIADNIANEYSKATDNK